MSTCHVRHRRSRSTARLLLRLARRVRSSIREEPTQNRTCGFHLDEMARTYSLCSPGPPDRPRAMITPPLVS